MDDAEGFAEFYLGSHRRLATSLFYVLADAEEVEDCLQEAYARAWLRWDRMRHEVDEPTAWVHTVAYRIAVSRWRRRAAHARALQRYGPPPDDVGPTPDAVAVRNALSLLPHAQRAVIVLHYFEGLGVEQIARMLRISPSGVKSRLARGRTALLPLLDDRNPDPDLHRGPRRALPSTSGRRRGPGDD